MAFGYYSAFTVQSSQVPSTQTDFPVLIYWTDARFKTVGNGGHVQNASGYDIRPYASDGTTALTYELVYYNGTTGQLEMWVKIASLADASVVRLYYGDAGLSSDASSTSTWDSNFKGVFHFPDGSSLSVANSSQTSISPTNHSVAAIAGRVGSGAGGGANTRYIDLGTVAGLNISDPVTLSAWVKTTATNLDPSLVVGGYKNSGSFEGYGLGVSIVNNKKISFWCGDLSGGWAGSTSDVNDDAWHHIAASLNSGSVAFYKDGSADGTASRTPSMSYSGQRCLFSVSDGSGNYFLGSIDEIRISDSLRSADWLATEYNNQNDQAAFWGLAGEQTVGGSVIRKNDLLAMMQ